MKTAAAPFEAVSLLHTVNQAAFAPASSRPSIGVQREAVFVGFTTTA
jgi:hypothetical protein